MATAEEITKPFLNNPGESRPKHRRGRVLTLAVGIALFAMLSMLIILNWNSRPHGTIHSPLDGKEDGSEAEKQVKAILSLDGVRNEFGIVLMLLPVFQECKEKVIEVFPAYLVGDKKENEKDAEASVRIFAVKVAKPGDSLGKICDKHWLDRFKFLEWIESRKLSSSVIPFSPEDGSIRVQYESGTWSEQPLFTLQTKQLLELGYKPTRVIRETATVTDGEVSTGRPKNLLVYEYADGAISLVESNESPGSIDRIRLDVKKMSRSGLVLTGK